LDTDSLIRGLSEDARMSSRGIDIVLAVACAAAALTAAVAFFWLLHPRADIATALQTPRFLLKFVLTLTLTVTAAATLFAAARPGARVHTLLLAVAPMLTALAVAAEFAMVPSSNWEARWIGSNAQYCLTYIPVMGLLPLVILLLAMRRGAPVRPALSGAVAGVLAGSVAATFYAAHCTDDSPFFVATWYTLAIALLALLGALAGRRLLRW
jgi:hypothetical protein